MKHVLTDEELDELTRVCSDIKCASEEAQAQYDLGFRAGKFESIANECWISFGLGFIAALLLFATVCGA